MSSRQGDIAITHSFDRIDGRNERRSIGLVGFGLTRPLDQRWRFEAVALGGFDLVDRPQLAWMPAVGARAGVEWQPRKWLFDGVQLSLTGVVDLSRKVSDRGIGGTVFATVSTGVGLPSR
jgi:hypothetical protein